MQTAAFCTQCGQRNTEGSRYCSGCGNALATVASVVANAPSAAMATPAPAPTPRRAPLASAAATQSPTKQIDEIFCQTCGAPIKREADICVHCGVRIRRYGASGAKSKTTSLLLAIFFSAWTWLYTYREDGAKFWIAMTISIVNWVLVVLTLGIWLIIGVFVWLGLWVWAIADTASKSDDWYASY